MKSFFRKFFGKKPAPQKNQKRGKVVRREERDLYKKGDIIGGKYEVHDILGKGGFGVVYLVFNRESAEVSALKTFRDELLADAAAREAFKKEALLWVGLGYHPFILTARWVEEFSGRLFVEMEHIAPDSQGRVSLADHLSKVGKPLETNRILKWAIQFCLGMEHANSQGIECHRDIKPANILIGQDENLKISDFGLAAAAEAAWLVQNGHGRALAKHNGDFCFRFSLIQSQGNKLCGTPGYISPQRNRIATCWHKRKIFSSSNRARELL
jgi:serine/threonine protein kinase